MRLLRCLVACECSGRVRDAFAALGWEARSADLLPSEAPGHHYQGDCRDLFDWNHPVNRYCEIPDHGYPWDLVVAHPPCFDLSYSGARWFKQKDSRRGGDGRMQRAADFFMDMIHAPSPLVAVENPHSIAQEPQWAGPPTQIVEPWMFGDSFVKSTHLWLKGLPPLVPTHKESDYPELFRAATGGGSWRTDRAAGQLAMSSYEDSEGRKNRTKVRSRTFPGLANAMAVQWSSFARRYYCGAR